MMLKKEDIKHAVISYYFWEEIHGNLISLVDWDVTQMSMRHTFTAIQKSRIPLLATLRLHIFHFTICENTFQLRTALRLRLATMALYVYFTTRHADEPIHAETGRGGHSFIFIKSKALSSSLTLSIYEWARIKTLLPLAYGISEHDDNELFERGRWERFLSKDINFGEY